MRLVIKPKSGKRRGYGGNGMFDTISRKIFSSGAKQVISSAAKSAIAQKIANAVVNGATSATQEAVKGAINETINGYVKPYISSKLKKKRPVSSIEEEVVESKRPKLNINDLINGSGIVFD